ncbi:MAG: Phage transcriptional regulator, RinA family [uncultured Clostridium sp.]
MSRDRFKKTEDKLYNYFNKEKKIATLNYRIELLKKQIDKINQELKECDVSIEVESSSPGFEERVQTSSDGTSYAEREVIRVTELKLKRKRFKEIEIEELKEKIENIELDNSILEYNLRYINKEWYKLLELKYKFKKNETQISFEMNISQSQVNKTKQKAIAEIRRWEEWRKVE